MKEVMKIEDSFLIKKTGLIVSGINYQVDALSKDEVKAEIGTKVRIVSGSQTLWYIVNSSLKPKSLFQPVLVLVFALGDPFAGL